MSGRRPDARTLARQVLRRVEREGAYANLALSAALERAPGLEDRDRALATELVYGVLKRRLRLDRALTAGAPRGLGGLDPLTLEALRVAAYQLLFLRVPDHAAIDDAVETVKRARGARLAGFANALLRGLASRGEPPFDAEPAARLAQEGSMPAWLAARLVHELGPEGAAALAAAQDEAPPLGLRANALRATRDELVAALAAERPDAVLSPSPYAPEGIAARRLAQPFATRSYLAGLFTAQDVAAQLVSRLVAPRAGERLLDACAGVGGKATHLAALTGDGVEIDAADASAQKLALCADHARRLGATRVRPVVCDLLDPHAAALASSYDRVLLDAPCSGLGVLRRHPEGKARRSPEDVVRLAGLQRALVAALAPRVRPGGLLVYSVCTFTDEEGPAQVRALLAADPGWEVERPEDPALAPLLGPDGALHTWPHLHDLDGFYAVRLRRRSSILRP